MKVKIFALVAAFFMLMGGSAWAQSDVKGDVNKDGVVNEQDIAAILAIMAKNNGVAEKTRYYWYAGWTEPTASNIATIVNEKYPTNSTQTAFANAGKTSTTTSGVTFDLLNSKLYDDVYLNAATTDRVKRNYYVVVPNGQGIYDSLGNTVHLPSDNTFTNVGTFTNHTIYRKNDASISIGAIIIK